MRSAFTLSSERGTTVEIAAKTDRIAVRHVGKVHHADLKAHGDDPLIEVGRDHRVDRHVGRMLLDGLERVDHTILDLLAMPAWPQAHDAAGEVDATRDG